MADDARREQAKALFMQGVTISDIARQLDVARRTVQRWKDEGNWETLKASITPPRAERPKIIDLHAPRPEPAPRPRRQPPGEMDLLQTVEFAIADASTVLSSASEMNNAQGFGSAAGALVRLIELRLKLQPLTAKDLAEAAIRMGLRPNEFMQELRDAWQKQA